VKDTETRSDTFMRTAGKQQAFSEYIHIAYWAATVYNWLPDRTRCDEGAGCSMGFIVREAVSSKHPVFIRDGTALAVTKSCVGNRERQTELVCQVT
jgi:hypothetical protein